MKPPHTDAEHEIWEDGYRAGCDENRFKDKFNFFAGHALQGIASCHVAELLEGKSQEKIEAGARLAYHYANAMIKVGLEPCGTPPKTNHELGT